MSTLKTNNFEHLDASSPNITLGIGGGVNISGIATAETGLRVTAGLVGIGTNIPSTALDVAGSNVPVVINSSNSNTYKIQLENAYTPVAYIGAATSEIYFADADAAEIARFNNDGLRLASGKGIDFQNTGAGSSTTSSSHLLDDYEEGTWTPGYAGATSAGSYTFTTQAGAYTKIGNRVTVDFKLLNIVTGSVGSGNVQITGLPFTVQNTVDLNVQGSVRFSQYNVNDSTIGISLQPSGNDAHCSIILTRDNTSNISLNVSEKQTDGADIYGSVTYFID